MIKQIWSVCALCTADI